MANEKAPELLKGNASDDWFHNKDVSSSDDSEWTTRPEKNILKLAEMNMANELNSAKRSKALVKE